MATPEPGSVSVVGRNLIDVCQIKMLQEAENQPPKLEYIHLEQANEERKIYLIFNLLWPTSDFLG